MSGESDLGTLLATTALVIANDIYVFATQASGQIADGLTPQMTFHEAEGLTLIITKAQADAFGMAYEYECRMITLTIHSSLAAVGFMAHISNLLAKAGISVNPVAGFYHDHLFVPVDKAQEAMQLLGKMN